MNSKSSMCRFCWWPRKAISRAINHNRWQIQCFLGLSLWLYAGSGWSAKLNVAFCACWQQQWLCAIGACHSMLVWWLNKAKRQCRRGRDSKDRHSWGEANTKQRNAVRSATGTKDTENWSGCMLHSRNCGKWHYQNHKHRNIQERQTFDSFKTIIIWKIQFDKLPSIESFPYFEGYIINWGLSRTYVFWCQCDWWDKSSSNSQDPRNTVLQSVLRCRPERHSYGENWCLFENCIALIQK